MKRHLFFDNFIIFNEEIHFFSLGKFLFFLKLKSFIIL